MTQCIRCSTHQSPKPVCGWCGAPLVVVRYGCHSCLAGYDVPTDVADSAKPWECPRCGDGFGEAMPADEQPTLDARRAVAWGRL